MDYGNDELYKVIIIQGDDIPIRFTLTGVDGQPVDTSLVTKLYFTCSYEDYQGEVTYSQVLQKWCITIPASTTKNFKPTSTTGTNYDLTALLSNGDVLTTIYRGQLSVFDKNNALAVMNDDE